MITCREGTPGSGKSYTAVVQDILTAVERGRKVVTNLPVNVPELNKRTRRSCEQLIVYYDEHQHFVDGNLARPFEHIEDWTRHQDWRNPDPEHEDEGPLYVVDEAHEVLGIDIAKQDCKDKIDWLATHRHVGVDVVLITQDHMELQLGARRRLEMRYEYTRTAAQFVGSKTGYHEKEYIKLSKKPINIYKKKFKNDNFPLYQSVVAGTSADVKQSVKPFWFQPKLMVMASLILFSVIYFAQYESSGELLPSSNKAEASLPAATQDPFVSVPSQAPEIPTRVLSSKSEPRGSKSGRVITYDHALQNVEARIASTFSIGGDATYYFEGVRGRQKFAWTDRWLKTHGYELIPYDSCSVFIHRAGYEGWTVSCDHAVVIDGGSSRTN